MLEKKTQRFREKSYYLIFVLGFFVWSPTREFFPSHGDVTIAGESLQILDLCTALIAIEQ